MILTRRALAPLFGALALAPLPTVAADKRKFTDAAFEAAVKAGGPVFVEVHAPWCPTCKQQAPHIARLLADPRFRNIAAFSVDFDSQKDALRRLNASKQSTLIVFKGGKELDRSVGDTDGQTITMLMETLL